MNMKRMNTKKTEFICVDEKDKKNEEEYKERQ